MEHQKNELIELDTLLLDIVSGGTTPVASSYLPFVMSAQAAPESVA